MSVTVWGLYSADVSRHLPGSCTLSRVITAALHLTLIFSEFAKIEQTQLTKPVVSHVHSDISVKIKLKIIASLLLCCRTSCQLLTLHHLGWRDGPKRSNAVGGRLGAASLCYRRERKFSGFRERRKKIVKPGAAVLLK